MNDNSAPGDDLRNAAERAGNRFPEYSQAREVFEETAERSLKRHKPDPSYSQSFAGEMEAVANLIADVRDAINPATQQDAHGAEYRKRLGKYEGDKDQSGQLWHFPSAASAIKEGTSSRHYWPINADALKESVERYLRSDRYRSATLERIMAAALAYQEVLSFAETLRDQPPVGRGFWGWIAAVTVSDSSADKIATRVAIVQWLTGSLWFLAAVFVGVAAWEQHGWWIGLLAGFGAFTLFMFYRLIDKIIPIYAQIRTGNLLSEMDAVSRRFSDRTVSPMYLRRRIYDTAAKGAEWPSALISLVEHAYTRNALAWRCDL